ncbi:hypothetical protein MTO96_022821 [Rhipicephalus appendiculatus]
MLYQVILISLASWSHFVGVSAAGTPWEDTCTIFKIENPGLVDAECIYETLKMFNEPEVALAAFADVIAELMKASNNDVDDTLAKQFVYTANQLDTSALRLDYCSGGDHEVNLNDDVVGQCNTDLGLDCDGTNGHLVSKFNSFIKCLLGNVLPSAPQDKITALLCDLLTETNTDVFEGTDLWDYASMITGRWC